MTSLDFGKRRAMSLCCVPFFAGRGVFWRDLAKKLLRVADEPNGKDYQRQNPRYIQPDFVGKPQSVPCICLFQEVFVSPAVLCGAENEINKASERQKVVRNDEIFYILDISHAFYSKTAPHIEAERTRQA